MKFLVVLFAILAAAMALPQFYPGFGGGGGGFSGSSSNAAASSQSFNQQQPGFGGFGNP